MKFTRANPSPQSHFHDVYVGLLDRLITKSGSARPDFNQRMFDEDFARIFQSSTHGTVSLFEVNSNDDELKKRLLGNVRTRYREKSFDDIIRQMIEGIAQSLLCFGEAYYFLEDKPDKEETCITSYSAEWIFTICGAFFQFLPKRYERFRNRDNKILGRELRLLDGKKLMRFRLPRSFKRILSAQKAILATLDKKQHASMDYFPNATYESPNPRNDFDFRVWNEARDFALYRATRETGWKGRKFDSVKRSDFFDCHRLIRFRRNQVKFRDQILAQLSDELTRVGKNYKSGFKIVFLPTNELPSVAQFNELEAKLSREEIGFSDVLDFCYKN